MFIMSKITDMTGNGNESCCRFKFGQYTAEEHIRIISWKQHEIHSWRASKASETRIKINNFLK